MKLWLRVFAGIAVAAIFISSAIYLRRPPNPVFEGRPASEWVNDLLSPDYSVRSEAQTALRLMSSSAVPQLIALLQERDAPWKKPLVRLNSVLTFLDYQPRDPTKCQVRAAEMLGLLGAEASPAVPHLIDVLGDDRSASEAERALLRIGDASTQDLQRALSAEEERVRERSARLLREFAPLQPTLIPPLVSAAGDPSPNVRKEAALTLGTFGKLQAVAALIVLARDREAAVRAAAFESLGKSGIAVATVIESLALGLNDGTPIVELEAAKALWRLRQDASLVVPVLTEILGTDERWQAAYALGEIGPRAAAAVPALVRVLELEEVPRPFRTPPSAAFALGQIGPAAINDLSALLEHAQARVRVSALLAFGFMGNGGRQAVPKLLKVLDDRDDEVRHTAALTLAAVGAEPKLIVPSLADCLRDQDIYVRSAAAAVLREIAPEGDWIAQAE